MHFRDLSSGANNHNQAKRTVNGRLPFVVSLVLILSLGLNV